MSLAEILVPGPHVWAKFALNEITLDNELDSKSTPTPLTWYEEFSAAGATYTGPFAAQAGVYSVVRVGKLVTAHFQAATGAATANAIITNSVPLPARFRPQFNISCSINVQDNATDVKGSCNVAASTGVVTIAVNLSTAFANAGNPSVTAFSMSWIVA